MDTNGISRRSMLAAAGALAASAAAGIAPARAEKWETSLGYPDMHWRALDPAGNNLRVGLARVEQAATGFNFVEGPVWFGAWGQTVFSDLGSGRQHLWDARTGQVSVFRADSNYTNGAAKDREGRLICCEQGLRRVVRIEHDGKLTVLADKYNGKKLNSPNDVVVKSDGSIWFTDPPNGLNSDYEGNRGGTQEQAGTYVYRIDPKSGQLSIVIEDIRPNGLCFSPDETKLYAVGTTPTSRGLRVYDVVSGGTKLANGRILVSHPTSSTDGFKCDEQGNIWAAWGGPDKGENGVRVFSSEGKPLLQLELPERAANLCFAGPKLNRLFVTAQQSIYTAWTNVSGAKLI